MEQGIKRLTVIEGGGSTCRGLVYDLTQNRIKGPLVLHSHPCNLHRDRDLTLRNLKIMLETLGAGFDPLTLCLPGVSNTENADWLKAELKTAGYDTIHLASDAIAALLGAYPSHEEGQGIFIGGTGAVALGYGQGQLWKAGAPETERACGPWIARQAWNQASHDPELKRIFGTDQDLTPDLNNAPHHTIATYAPAVFQLAKAGNLRAEAILQEAAASADDFMIRMQQIGISRFVLCGSVAQALRTRITFPTETAQGDGVDGALRLALSVYKNPQALSLFTNIRRIEDEEQERRAVNQ